MEVINLELGEYDLFSEENMAKGYISELYAIIQSMIQSVNVYPQLTFLFERDQQRSEK